MEIDSTIKLYIPPVYEIVMYERLHLYITDYVQMQLFTNAANIPCFNQKLMVNTI